jgi:hypothetical protein
MTHVLRLFIRLAAAALLVGTAAGATLDRAGLWTPTPVPGRSAAAPTSRSLVNDGSFELGPPPASAWTEVSVPACEWIGDFSSAWYVSAYDGSNDYWAGGYCTDENTGDFLPATSSVTQSVAVTASESTLSFHFISFRLDADDEPADGDRAYVAVNGVEVWSSPFLQANNTYPDWTGPITVDLSAYAGQTVALTFGGVSVGTATGNARFDYVEFVPGQTPTTAASWSTFKSLYR